jgi:hypothetical protein
MDNLNGGLTGVSQSPKASQTIDAIRSVLYDIRMKLGYIMPNIEGVKADSQTPSAIHPLQRDLENLLQIANELKDDINL